MSRVFTKNISNYMTLGVGSVGARMNGASKIVIHCFAKANSVGAAGANDNRLFASVVGANLKFLSFSIDGNTAGGPFLRAGGRSQGADSFQATNGDAIFTVGDWHSCGAILDIAGDTITVFLDGKKRPTTAVTFGASTYTDDATNRTVNDAIGCDMSLSAPTGTAGQFDGSISKVALWKFPAAHTMPASDFRRLANGVDAKLIQRGFLAAYMGLGNQGSIEYDEIGSLIGSINSYVPPSTDPVSMRRPRRYFTLAAAAGFHSRYYYDMISGRNANV